jgi:Meckel syndrome type 1 protein
VSSYDAWDRYRPEGYGALSLRPHDQTGARAREVRTWRAGGTIRDRIATHYVGGAPEIGNLSYVAAPAFGAERDAGSQKVHSRLGFVADASGVIAVRAHAMTQRPKALSAGARKGVSALRGVLAKGKGLGFGGPGARDQTSLGGGEALDVDDDAENAAPGNGSARGDSDQTEDVVARARRAHRGGEGAGATRPGRFRASHAYREGRGRAAGAGAARVVDFDFVARRNRRVDALGDDAALERRVT